MRIHPGMPDTTVRTSREVWAENGELRMGIDFAVPDEIFEQWKQGYRCAGPPHGCFAAQREAFPEKCIEPYCNFNLKRVLASWLEYAYRGEEALWPAQDDGFDPERDAFARRSGIWLPGDA